MSTKLLLPAEGASLLIGKGPLVTSGLSTGKGLGMSIAATAHRKSLALVSRATFSTHSERLTLPPVAALTAHREGLATTMPMAAFAAGKPWCKAASTTMPVAAFAAGKSWCKAAPTTMSMTALAATGERRCKAAAPMSAATATLEDRCSASVAASLRSSTAMTAGLAAAVAAALRSLCSTATVAAAMVAWIRVCRGSDRQRGDARGEKYPGQHRKFSFRTTKTVRSPHRSNR